MANKKEFKKYVTRLSSAICQDMMTAYYNIDGVNYDKIDDAVIKVLQATEIAIIHANVKFDKSASAFENDYIYNKEKRSYYRKLYKKINSEYSQSLKEAIHQFNESMPKDMKDAN